VLKLHHAPNSRSGRIIWLLKELELDYELNAMAFHPKDLKSEEHRARHPLGRIPVLDDGDVRIFESGAIVEYLLAKYGNGRMRPEVNSADFPAYLQWLHYAEGMLMPPVNVIVVETILLPEERRNQTNVDRAVKLLSRMLGAVDAALEGREYLTGEFSGADIMSGHACVVSARLGGDISDKANVAAYIERLMARPALQKAFAA